MATQVTHQVPQAAAPTGESHDFTQTDGWLTQTLFLSATPSPSNPPINTRWTMPERCAFSSASAIWIATRRSSSAGIGPFVSRSASDSPSRNSITR